MLSYPKVQNKPRILHCLTGLTRAEFEALLPSFEAAWQTFIEDHFIHPTRNCCYGRGRKTHLTQHRGKQLFILFYFRHYPTQEVQGLLFGMSQAQISKWIRRLTQMLNQALGKEQQLPERNPLRLEAVLSACPGLEFIVDGTERPVNRPKNREIQRKYHSDS